MSYIRYKIIGNNKYAYEVKAYWGAKLKYSKQKTTYLGIVDQYGKIVPKVTDQFKSQLLLDFGDSYLINELVKQ